MAAVQNLEKIAADYGNQEIEQEHLLYSLLTIDDSLILKLIEKMGITKETMMNRVEELLRKRPKVQGGQMYIGQNLNNVLMAYCAMRPSSQAPRLPAGRCGFNHILGICPTHLLSGGSVPTERNVTLKFK